jgi:ferredoxin
MVQKSVIFHFPADLYDKPIVSQLVRDWNVEVNILQAAITPQERGHMFAIVDGEEQVLDSALSHIEGLGVTTVLPVQNLVWDEEKCVHCGACVGLCRPKAFSHHPDTGRVVFDSSRCIACDRCIPACAYGAVESIREYLKRKGGTNGQNL